MNWRNSPSSASASASASSSASASVSIADHEIERDVPPVRLSEVVIGSDFDLI